MKICVRMWRKQSMNENREYCQLIMNVKDTTKLIDSFIKINVNGTDSLWKVSKWNKAT